MEGASIIDVCTSKYAFDRGDWQIGPLSVLF